MRRGKSGEFGGEDDERVATNTMRRAAVVGTAAKKAVNYARVAMKASVRIDHDGKRTTMSGEREIDRTRQLSA